MLLTPAARLEERIVEVLAQSPESTAELLRNRIEEQWRRYSLQAVYKELRKLETNGVVVRRGGRYVLRYLWLLEMMEFSQQGYEAFRQSGSLIAELPQEGEKRSWVLHDLRRLMDLWTDLFFQLVETEPRENRFLCEYVHHVWFHTANPVNESHFLRAMKNAEVKFLFVTSNDTYLDQSYKSVLKKLDAQYSFGARGFPAREHQYYSVFGDYLINVRLAPSLDRHIERFYAATNSARDLSAQKVLEFAQHRGRCKLELSCNPKRAERLRGSFARFFGTSLRAGSGRSGSRGERE